MEISLESARQLASFIATAYIANVQNEERDGLCDLATIPSYGFRLELSLAGEGTWSFDDIGFVETAGSSSRPDPNDRRYGIAGYMPETALVKPNDPLHKIDAFVKLWKVSLPTLYEDLGDQDRWAQLERFKSLIADTPALRGAVQKALCDRVDANFLRKLTENVHDWLSQGHASLVILCDQSGALSVGRDGVVALGYVPSLTQSLKLKRLVHGFTHMGPCTFPSPLTLFLAPPRFGRRLLACRRFLLGGDCGRG